VVASDAGVDVHASEDFQSCWEAPDILFVPGNALGVFKQLQDDRTLDFIADIGSRAAWVTSFCNGSFRVRIADNPDGNEGKRCASARIDARAPSPMNGR
jgi:putative intracellular protease/amidase